MNTDLIKKAGIVIRIFSCFFRHDLYGFISNDDGFRFRVSAG